MSSVKCITGRDQREARPRKSKTDARERLVEVEEIDEDAFNETMINQAEQAAEQKKKKVNTVRVTNNAPKSELNMCKQFRDRLNACNREVFKVDKEKGSANRTKQKIVKAEFQTGVFEVSKKNMVKVMTEQFNVEIIADPKVETYGGLTEQIKAVKVWDRVFKIYEKQKENQK